MKKQSKNFALRQLMLSFAYLAYTGEEIQGPNPEDKILESINAALPKIKLSGSGNESLEDWEIAWGPVTYTVPGAKYQENMMFVVNKKGTSDYIIASRGTNFVSQVDWFLDDFELYYTMPWPLPDATSKSPEGAAISESTSIDMYIHLDDRLMADKNGVGLLRFLNDVTEKDGPINICVTGHSLGAAVANTLSLFLLENPDIWDASSKSTVSCISFAAPTVGNGIFVESAMNVFEEAAKGRGSFPGWDKSMDSNLDNVQCSLDTVPLFSVASNIYNKGGAGQLFDIYAAPNNPTNNIKIDYHNLSTVGYGEWYFFQSWGLKKIAATFADQKYTQFNTKSRFAGDFIGNTLKVGVEDLPTYLEAFGSQAAWQHTNSYPIFLDLPIVLDPNIVPTGGGRSTAKPHIDSVDPSNNEHYYVSQDVKITIKGSNFSSSLFGNFIVFSDDSKVIPYSVTKATETEIHVVFHIKHLDEGKYNFNIYTTSPYFISNEATFTIYRGI